MRGALLKAEFDAIRGVYGAVSLDEFESSNFGGDWEVWYEVSNDGRIDWQEYYSGDADLREWNRLSSDNTTTLSKSDAISFGYTEADYDDWLDPAGDSSVDFDDWITAMIAKNTWETEYDTMLDEATYLTED